MKNTNKEIAINNKNVSIKKALLSGIIAFSLGTTMLASNANATGKVNLESE